MALTASDLKFFRSKTITDDASNGGRMDETAEVVDGVKYNLFPRVSYNERVNGTTRYRKLFFANRNTNNDAAYNPLLALIGHSTGDDRFYIVAATQTDTQADASGYTGWTGGGLLNADIAAGATSMDVLFENNDYDIPQGGTLVITDGTNTEFLTISTTTAATWTGNVATIALETQTANAYAAGAKVGICINGNDLTPSVSGVSITSSSGTFDDTQVSLENVGTVYDVWTITFTSSTAFQVSGQYEGSLPNGDISTDYAPSNPNTATPYFTIPASAWSGTWAAGDTVQFTTNPAAMAVWLKEVVPAGANREPNNEELLLWYVE